MAFVQAPPAPSASGSPNLDTSCTSAEVWLSMHPENMLQNHNIMHSAGRHGTDTAINISVLRSM